MYKTDSPSENPPIKINKNRKRGIKRSLRAKIFAQEVVKSTLKGDKRTKKDIAISLGYSPKSASTDSITRTKSYKEEIAPVIAQHNRIIGRILNAMENAPLDNQNIVALSIAKKNITHDVQLISGKSTENVLNATPQIVVYSPADPLAIQLRAREVQALEDSSPSLQGALSVE